MFVKSGFFLLLLRSILAGGWRAPRFHEGTFLSFSVCVASLELYLRRTPSSAHVVVTLLHTLFTSLDKFCYFSFLSLCFYQFSRASSIDFALLFFLFFVFVDCVYFFVSSNSKILFTQTSASSSSFHSFI